jgi:hypothetical protein
MIQAMTFNVVRIYKRFLLSGIARYCNLGALTRTL